MAGTIQQDNLPLQGRTAVTTTAIPITKVGDTSSANTTFTQVRCTDASAWDLSAISAGDIAVTSDGYRGVVETVVNASNYIEVVNWAKDGVVMWAATVTPADGSTLTFHKVNRCKKLLITALEANGALILVSTSETGATTGHELSNTAANPNSVLPLEALLNRLLDPTTIWVKSASGTQNLSWWAS